MFWSALGIQRRILSALFMREMQTRWGRRNLGFAWLFAEPLVFALPVLTLWYIIRPKFDNGIPMMPFLWTGYLPMLIFRHVTGQAMYVIRSNGALLYHAKVTPFDIFCGRCVLEALGNIASVAASFVVFYMVGVLDLPYDFPLMVEGFLLMTWWSFAVAMLVAALSERSEMVEHIWTPVAYVYIMLSGFPFMAYWLPPGLRQIALTINPPLLAYEIIRGGFYGNLVPTYQYPGYLSEILAVMTFIGLWLMRHVRAHVEIL